MTITNEFKQEVKDYCGISGTDSDTQVETLIQTADEFIQGAVGEYPAESNRAKSVEFSRRIAESSGTKNGRFYAK